MDKVPVYVIWDFWTDKDKCYAVYEKETEGKLYFTEAPKAKIKLLEQQTKKSKKFMGFIKKMFKRKDK